MTPNQTIFAPMPGQTLSVAFSGTAGTTAALPQSTDAVYIVVTSDAFIRLGGTATTSDMYLPSFTPMILDAVPGLVVSAIQVSSSGTLYATPIA